MFCDARFRAYVTQSEGSCPRDSGPLPFSVNMSFAPQWLLPDRMLTGGRTRYAVFLVGGLEALPNWAEVAILLLVLSKGNNPYKPSPWLPLRKSRNGSFPTPGRALSHQSQVLPESLSGPPCRGLRRSNSRARSCGRTRRSSSRWGGKELVLTCLLDIN